MTFACWLAVLVSDIVTVGFVFFGFPFDFPCFGVMFFRSVGADTDCVIDFACCVAEFAA
ncbi:hypothetical protein D3C85_1620830 [compost metagenome]